MNTVHKSYHKLNVRLLLKYIINFYFPINCSTVLLQFSITSYSVHFIQTIINFCGLSCNKNYHLIFCVHYCLCLFCIITVYIVCIHKDSSGNLSIQFYVVLFSLTNTHTTQISANLFTVTIL